MVARLGASFGRFITQEEIYRAECYAIEARVA